MQSIPAQGALPQTFETVQAIEARPEWNALRPRLTQDQPIAANMQTITAYAQAHLIARLTFWSLNRDRQCPGAYPNDDTCSGVAQASWAYTQAIAAYKG